MIRNEFEKLLDEMMDLSKYNIYIWGTGNTTSLYQEGLDRLYKEGFSIVGYCDNNKNKWGTTVFGKKVYSPKELLGLNNVLVLICSPQPKVITAVANQLNDMCILWRHIDSWILKSHKQEVLKCYDLLGDSRSKDVYSHLVECRIKGLYPDERWIDNEQYFGYGNFGEYNPDEIFIDCGAYVGDSLEQFIWSKEGVFDKIIAFEPDLMNFNAMNKRVERLCEEWNLDASEKIKLYPYGVGEKNDVYYCERYEGNNGLSSKITSSSNDNTEKCEVISIDEFFNEKYTFLKADIESYEYKMLLGAKETIKKNKPKLAICIYHNAVDFYSIPLLIKKICPDYIFAVRHYTHMLSDTILYCYVK